MPGWSIALIGWSTMAWLVACYQLGVLRQWHHYWIGAALVVAAALLHWPTWLQAVGGVVALRHAGLSRGRSDPAAVRFVRPLLRQTADCLLAAGVILLGWAGDL